MDHQSGKCRSFLRSVCIRKLYRDGVYFEKDMDQAMKWFRSSAELGNAYAAYQMGQLLLLGKGGSKDVETAMKWLKMSAEKGNSIAQYRLECCI